MLKHVEGEIIQFLAGELTPGDRARIAAHVDGCAECRRAVEETRTVLASLAASRPLPPMPDWGRYQAEVRARVEVRRAGGRSWWSRPVTLLASVGLVAALLLMSVQDRGSRTMVDPEFPAAEETAVGARLELLKNYPIMERLDLLEDLDVIRQLDQLPVRDG